MNWLLRVLLAIVVGVLVCAILDWLGVLTTTINALLGVVAALVTYFGWNGTHPVV